MTEKMIETSNLLFKQAQSCEKLNDSIGAIEAYQSAIALKPDFFEAYHNLAIALRNIGKLEEAFEAAKSAAKLCPSHPQIQYSLGLSFESLGQHDSAISAYKHSLKLQPDYTVALNNLGRLLEVKGDVISSIDILEKASALAPSSIEININLANSLLAGGKPAKSMKILEEIVNNGSDIDGTLLSIISNSLGVSAHVLGYQDVAIDNLRKSISLSPDFAEAHENLAQILLLKEKYHEAWIEYEWRWKNENNKQSRRSFTSPEWKGETLKDEILLIHAEQGYGDVIQFIRFLPLIQTGKFHLILACHPELIELFLNIPGIDQITDINVELPPYDKYVHLLSLPRILNIDSNNIPNKPYINLKKTDNNPFSKTFNVGMAWAGKPRHEFDPHRNRSCPVKEFLPLAELNLLKDHLNLCSLQTGKESTNLEKINSSGSITDLNPRIQTFNDTALQLVDIDLVITVDTALAHLAGAMGKKVWLLLATCADWRWQDKEITPWYPETRIFRQQTPGDWTNLIKIVIKELSNLIP